MALGELAGLQPRVYEGSRGRSSRPPAVLLIPAALVGAAVLLPVAYLALRSLEAGTETWDLLLRPRTLAILARSLLLAATVTAASVAIAVPLAWLTVRTDLPLRGLWSVLTALPLVIPSYLGAFLVVTAIGPKGLLQGWLAPIGVERLPSIYGFAGAWLVLTLLSYPYVLLPVRAALARMDAALEESSRSLGRSAWQTFLLVTLPLLKPAIAAGALLVALYTLSDFGAVSLLRFETFTWAIYVQYGSFARDSAAVLSLMLAALALGILVVESRTRGRSRYDSTDTGGGRPPTVVRLGRWRWPAVALCAAVVALALAMPAGVLAYWAARGFIAGETLPLVWSRAWNSLFVSGLAAAVTVAAALPVALLAVRYPGGLGRLLERVSYVGFALPGIAVALALVFLGVRFATPLYQTLAMLVFAYVVLFLPTALGSVRASLLQVSPALEEAARSLGATQLRAVFSVTIPLVRSGALAGGALVFLLVMKELPATLILSPIGFETLAVSIWGAASEAFFARAAVESVLLLLASWVPMAFLVLRSEVRER
ncbi:MAG: iron ABC transporter permease [Chloroflexota bacterium]|nr:iron ABC transporter permease [Chloroflexota bacterium]MDE2941962.1 iron ABC transporter permease [Chloroflexota bacterium]MDE3267060.1 iron ABC transporter permease [Chloroflexota bacterium]